MTLDRRRMLFSLAASAMAPLLPRSGGVLTERESLRTRPLQSRAGKVDWAAVRALFPLSEDWTHLASLLYAWALGAPGSLFERIETAAHIELAIFHRTRVGVPAIVRRLLGRRAPLSWAALFLFPGIFCYASGLVLGSDHVAAQSRSADGCSAGIGARSRARVG